MEQNKKGKKELKINGSMIVLLCALVIVVGVFTFLNKNFFSYTNLVNVFVAASLVGLVAIGDHCRVKRSVSGVGGGVFRRARGDPYFQYGIKFWAFPHYHSGGGFSGRPV